MQLMWQGSGWLHPVNIDPCTNNRVPFWCPLTLPKSPKYFTVMSKCCARHFKQSCMLCSHKGSGGWVHYLIIFETVVSATFRSFLKYPLTLLNNCDHSCHAFVWNLAVGIRLGSFLWWNNALSTSRFQPLQLLTATFWSLEIILIDFS